MSNNTGLYYFERIISPLIKHKQKQKAQKLYRNIFLCPDKLNLKFAFKTKNIHNITIKTQHTLPCPLP